MRLKVFYAVTALIIALLCGILVFEVVQVAALERERREAEDSTEPESSDAPEESVPDTAEAESTQKQPPLEEAAFHAQLLDNMVRYRLDDARALLDEAVGLWGETDFLRGEAQLLQEYTAFQEENLEEYVVLRELYNPDSTRKLENLFTHCLIAFPEICYSSPAMMRSLDTDCLTPHEFVKILENLYEKNYILIDPQLLLTENADGSVSLTRTLALPKGKIPCVLSVDDVTYDSRKMGMGMVDRLIVDDNGRIATLTRQNGEDVIRYDNEIFPILYDFIRSHPDFTFHGARGMLNLTGFDGIFGYRTQSSPHGEESGFDRQAEIASASAVAAALREEGWRFASHSYGHYQMSALSEAAFRDDVDSWLSEVASIVGDCDIWVWPYGDHGNLREGARHAYLWEKGFRMFWGVGANPYWAAEPDGLGLFSDRKMLTGQALRDERYAALYAYLYDAAEVWDPLRPKTIS